MIGKKLSRSKNHEVKENFWQVSFKKGEHTSRTAIVSFIGKHGNLVCRCGSQSVQNP